MPCQTGENGFEEKLKHDTSREIRCLITDPDVSDETLRQCGGVGLDLITV